MNTCWAKMCGILEPKEIFFESNIDTGWMSLDGIKVSRRLLRCALSDRDLIACAEIEVVHAVETLVYVMVAVIELLICNGRSCLLVDLFEIREIRPGRNSKDFERFKDGKDKLEEHACFTIFYGSQFVLNTLSLGGEIYWARDTLILHTT